MMLTSLRRLVEIFVFLSFTGRDGGRMWDVVPWWFGAVVDVTVDAGGNHHLHTIKSVSTLGKASFIGFTCLFKSIGDLPN